MIDFFSLRYNRFISNEFVWKTSFLNSVLCGCMAYFFWEEGFNIESLLYGVFFLVYILIVFFFGEKSIPVLYVIFSMGAVQDITFINATVFLILMMVSWQFPKWKFPLAIIYILQIVIVCMRHEKTSVHLLFHIALCLTLYAGCEAVKKTLQKRAIMSISKNFKKLDLRPEEEDIIKQRAEGKMYKEIISYSKNTITAYITLAMERNGCKTKEELIAMYAIQKRLEG